MDKKQRLELAKQLINDVISATNKRCKGNDFLTYAWDWRSDETVSSNHSTQFFYLDEIKSIADGLSLNLILTVGPNLDGDSTPYITIW